MHKAAQDLISVVLPTLNGAAYLRQSIDSIILQTHQHLELIIVDDGSTNTKTLEIIREYETKDDRIRVLRLGNNRGLPAALNLGLAATRGTYVSWTSDDNYYEPNALEKLLHMSISTQSDMVFSNCVIYNQHGKVQRIHKPFPLERFCLYNVAGACFLYRREIHDRIGWYDPTMILSEDYDFFLRAYCQGVKMAVLDEPLYHYRRHEGGLTLRRAQEANLQSLRTIRKYFYSLPPVENYGQAHTAYALMRRYSKIGRHRDVLWALGAGLKTQPLRLLSLMIHSLLRRGVRFLQQSVLIGCC